MIAHPIARRFAVVGDPVAHSKSPAMHSAAFRALGLPHTYEAVRAHASDLARIVSEMRAGAFDGLNITVPHKEIVLPLADALDESARVAGAANTLVRRADGAIVAYNTDAPALADELAAIAQSPDCWAEARGLVLGSGGAARAAIAAFARLGVKDIVVRARAFDDDARARAFASAAPCPISTQPWRRSSESERGTFALVQATSAGMRGADAGEGVADVVAWDALGAGAVAVDVVYAPRDTPWLRAARARGLRSDDGLGMLARQGALALKLWLEREAPLAAMRAALQVQ